MSPTCVIDSPDRSIGMESVQFLHPKRCLLVTTVLLVLVVGGVVVNFRVSDSSKARGCNDGFRLVNRVAMSSNCRSLLLTTVYTS